MLPYAIALIVFAVLDGVWLGLIAGGYYREQLGGLLADPIKWVPAVAFYLIYVVGLVNFAIHPAVADRDGMFRAFILGAGLGLVAYATYNLTVLSVIKGYPTNLAMLDLAWGTFASGLTAALTYFAVERLSN